MPKSLISDVERFLTHVNHDGPVAKNNPDLGPCWLWTGGRTPDGYGVFSIGGKSVRSHRWFYIQVFGEPDVGLVLDHFACDTPSWGRPTHMRPVTVRENNLRSDCVLMALRAVGSGGGSGAHAVDGYIWRGIRYCRPCRSAYMRRWVARKKAEA